MSPAVKNGIMLAALVVVLAAAGFFYSRGKKETIYPSTGYETQWMCDKCSKHYELTPAQYKDWLDSKDKLRRDPNYPRNVIVFWCSDCSAFSVVRATVDKQTGQWSIPRDSAGNLVGEAKDAAAPAKDKPKEKGK